MDQKSNMGMEESNKDRKHVIPVVHEHATVHTEVVETGTINIRKRVIEENVQVNAPIINESYSIERISVKGDVTDTPPPSVRYEGDVMIIPVVREITVVEKRYEVVEELRITRVLTETPLVHEITLRKEEVKVERSAPGDGEAGKKQNNNL